MSETANDDRRDVDALPWGEHAPWFVSRRRAWLHAVLSGAERAPRAE
jgi:hypothetical protein